MRALLFLLFVLVWLTGCAVNPVTGRNDFVMMSEQQELALGARYSQEILQQYPRYADESLQAYVQQVGERVAQHSHRNQLDYRFTVLDTPELNAFALPGGHIFIHRGLLAYLNSEAELAAVLGHELGHVTARHSVRQHGQATAWGLLGQALAIGTGVGAAGDLTQLLGSAFVRGYGRDMELEADGLGAEYLARGQYDPQAMIEVVKVLKNQDDFARAQAAQRGEPVDAGYHGLFATHPDHDRRLQEVLGPAQALAGGVQEVNRQGFLERLRGLPFGDSTESGVRRGARFYHGALNFFVQFPDGWELINQPEVLVARRPDGQAFLAMTLETPAQGQTPAEFLRARVGGQPLVQEAPLRLQGIAGHTAVIPGRGARRVATLFKDGRAYLFVGAVKASGSLEAEDERFLAAIRSFRPLAPAEQALAQPQRLQLVRVKAGQTLAALAKGSVLGEDAEMRLRLLNNLYPSGEPKSGDWLKVVR